MMKKSAFWTPAKGARTATLCHHSHGDDDRRAQRRNLSLTWDCIDFDKRLAHIKDSKNGKPRSIGLVDSVIKELKNYLNDSRPMQKPLVFAQKQPLANRHQKSVE